MVPIGSDSLRRAGLVAYGPVADKNGGYGAGFWALPDDVYPKPITDNDP
jgi:hypothetical protein